MWFISTGLARATDGTPEVLDHEGAVPRRDKGLERGTTHEREKERERERERESERETREGEAGHGLGCSRLSSFAGEHGGRRGGLRCC